MGEVLHAEDRISTSIEGRRKYKMAAAKRAAEAAADKSRVISNPVNDEICTVLI